MYSLEHSTVMVHYATAVQFKQQYFTLIAGELSPSWRIKNVCANIDFSINIIAKITIHYAVTRIFKFKRIAKQKFIAYMQQGKEIRSVL